MNNNSKFIASCKGVFSKISAGFAWFFGRFKGLNTLIAMQLKENLNISFKTHLKESLTKVILYLVLLAGLTGVILLAMSLLQMLGVLGVGGYLPISTFNVFFYFIFILNTFSCVLKLTNSLYFSEDNQVLIAYPVKGNTIFLSKLVVYYVLEIVKNFTFLVPLFLAYGILNAFPFYFYPWLIFCFFFLALLPVAVGSLLSIPVMYIKAFMRKFQIVQTIVILLLLFGITVFIFWAVNLLPADLQIASRWADDYFPAINKFTQSLEVYLKPLVYLSGLLIGYHSGMNNNPRVLSIVNGDTGFILLALVGIIILLIVLAYLIVRPLYFRMASKQFEYQKKTISHKYRLLKTQYENLDELAFVPVLEKELTHKERLALTYKLQTLLRILNKEEKLFLRRKIDERRIKKFLKKYCNEYTFNKISKDELIESKNVGYAIEIRNEVPSLICFENKGLYADCYDPNFLKKKNHKKDSMTSNLLNEIIVDLRTPGNLVNNYLMFIVTPIAVLILNSVFNAMSTSAIGKAYTILFNVLVITLIIFATNVSVASVYSREGKSSYLLKAAPVNYYNMLGIKLVIRFVIVTCSLIFSIIIYAWKSNITYLNPALLFFAVWFIYLGHLLWSAELDFMNPLDNLYANAGSGNINNSNETLSAIISFILSFAVSFMYFFMMQESTSSVFIKMFIIGLVFLLARIGLFGAKVRAYGTSRAERRDQ